MTTLGSAPQVTLTRREWQEFRVEPGGLQEGHVERLHGLATSAARHLGVSESGVLLRTHRGLKAQQVTGIVAIPGAVLEILPKIEGDDGAVRSALIRMLAVAYNLRVSEGELASLQTQKHDLLELLIRLFCERLLAAVKQGLSRQYQDFEEDLPVFRGRLLIKRQLTTYAARPDRLACRFDELNENTPLNRVLKAAVLRLLSIARSAENGRRLQELVSRLEMVGMSLNPLAEPVRPNRTNTAFHEIYPLARLFLSGDWQSTAGGYSSGFALLFPMNDLFEAYIGKVLRQAALPRPVRLQDRRHHALRTHDNNKGVFSLRPDAVVQTDAGAIVVDTKWKKLDATDHSKFGVSQADVYQMLAYAHAYKANRLVLLYPWDSHLPSRGQMCSWRFSGTDQVLDIWCVDVSDPQTVIGQLSELLTGASSVRISTTSQTS